jgi:predicted lipoprotein with Yx(FWY)xxD motif
MHDLKGAMSMGRRVLRTLACGVLLVAGACGDDGNSSQPQAANEPEPTATVQAAESALGTILTDAEGRTLYMFLPDKGTKSVCYGDCAEAWPAITVEDTPVAGDGLQPSLLDTSSRKDGSLQVTYGGLPLYYFAFDENVGDTNGQGSDDVWWVVSPEGKPIRN